MRKNMSLGDRIIRIVISAVLAILYFTGTVTGFLGFLAIAVAAIFTLTALVTWCPIYAVFGWKTCRTDTEASPGA